MILRLAPVCLVLLVGCAPELTSWERGEEGGIIASGVPPDTYFAASGVSMSSAELAKAAGLDQKVEQDFFELLQELNRHLTIVLVTHDLGFVAGFVRTVICVHGHVDIHPTSALDGRAISEIYGGEVRMVRHDHRMDH